ncbi:hypothetical protein MGN70_006459 [Eutypa lata]|uniref:Putative cdp-alcohol phosphatidyltransferase protein n=1 Tax=Eutypa lata (strain UCR-EL1) TaxID=1287681 RepID=M7SZ88_EUTLA|nr:putative cdp-alcohol phosphatidyltransferase protein [Eutypa lata UCREL1]KAI1251889.1 hypothetical protein MGN70_006459 [Eutypa lata]
MPSLKTTILAAATMLLSAVRADYVIDPSSVSMTLRDFWCQQETSSCPLICQQVEPRTTEINTCDPETLTYGCLCGNGLQPNLTEYSLTIPYFTCTEWGNQCVTGCNGDSACQSECRQGNPCGARDPTKANKTAIATESATQSATGTASATDAGETVYDGLDGAGSTETASPDSAAIRMLESGSFGGFLVLMASVCAGVGLVL